MYDITQIKQRITCVAVAQRCGLPIKRPGDRCVSPLRTGASNKTSFMVDDDFWYDFGSGSGGDAIDLLAEIQFKGDRGAAIRELASITGVQDDNPRSNGWVEYTQNLCNQIAHWQTKLTDDDRNYLHARGITDDTISNLRIGRTEEGRLCVPYLKNGYVAYYITRYLPGGAYPDSKYRKQKIDDYCEHIVWGLDSLNRDSDTLVIAEGMFDVMSFYQEGYPCLSAITGNFSSRQLPVVLSAAKQFKRVFLVYDNDKISHAGEKFTLKMSRILFRNKIPFVVGRVPAPYKDVSEYYADGGNLKYLVESAVDGMPFLAKQYTDLDDLRNFIFSINRFSSETAIAGIIESCSDNFSQRELAALQREASKPPTESIIADEIIKKHNVLYVDQVGFYEWNGKHWAKTTDAQIRNYADQLYGKQFSTAQRINAVCNLLKGRALRNVVFDRNPVITFQNGTLEIESGKIRDFSEDDYCSICMNYNYDADATCPVWTEFIDTITNGEPISAETLQFIGGYVLFPNCKHQKVFILMGDGGNGKSVYLEILQKIYGDENVTHIEPTGLTQEFQRIRLKDSLLNIGADINSDFSRGEIREWLLKLADGTTIQACYKGMTHVDFVPRCKLVYACNQLPTADVVNGLNRRFQFVNFPCRFVENPDPNDPLQHPRDVDIIPKLLSELPGIFNWCFEGYRMLSTVGYFSDTPDQTDMLQQFETTSNPVAVFCEDYSFGGFVGRDEIYLWYKQWCEETGHKALSREKFLPKFREKMRDRIIEDGQRRVDGKRVRGFAFKD